MSKVRMHEPDGFIEFWEVWQPHMRTSDGRGKARDRYRRELLENYAEPQDIIDGAKAFIRHHKALPPSEQRFIPLASSWLHAESYSTWAQRERAYQAHVSQQPAKNVVPIKPNLPETHFSVQYERRKAAE